MKTITEQKIEALAEHLEIDTEDIDDSSYDKAVFEDVEGDEYLVLTDDEADERACEDIHESLWAFSAWFIVDHIDARIDAETIEKLCGDMCEDANPIIEKLIDDVDDFIDDAIGLDGRGNFLSRYDGEEIEAGEFFIYRV